MPAANSFLVRSLARVWLREDEMTAIVLLSTRGGVRSETCRQISSCTVSRMFNPLRSDSNKCLLTVFRTPVFRKRWCTTFFMSRTSKIIFIWSCLKILQSRLPEAKVWIKRFALLRPQIAVKTVRSSVCQSHSYLELTLSSVPKYGVCCLIFGHKRDKVWQIPICPEPQTWLPDPAAHNNMEILPVQLQYAQIWSVLSNLNVSSWHKVQTYPLSP